MRGWIKLHRKIKENPVFNDLQLYRLWTICLLEATHKERQQLVGKTMVDLKPGQFITGRFDLHELYNHGIKKKDKVSEYTVWRWLKNLERYDFLHIKSNTKFSIVTIENWSVYQCDDQGNEQQVSNKRSSNDHQMSTNKNVNNDKNDIYTVFEFWNSKEIIKHQKMNQKMQSHINARLEEYSLDEIKNAIDNYKTVLDSDQYYWSHKWTLQDFMKPNNVVRFMDGSDPLTAFLKNKGQNVVNYPSRTQQNLQALEEYKRKHGIGG